MSKPSFNLHDIVRFSSSKQEMTITKVHIRHLSLSEEDLKNPIFLGKYTCKWQTKNGEFEEDVFNEADLILVRRYSNTNS